MKISAAVVREEKGPFIVENVDLRDPNDNEILVKIVATGLCHTDLTLRDQSYPVPLPVVLGHEGAGLVEKTGRNITKVQPGDHVVLTMDTCGHCQPCYSGNITSCDNLFELNFSVHHSQGLCTIHDNNGEEINSNFFGQSSFASFALCHERNTVKVQDDIPIELLGPLGCGVQTGAGSVLNTLHPEAGSSIAIYGSGSVGLSAVMAAKVAGCTKIIIVDIKPNRLEVAKEFGATHILNGTSCDPMEEIIKLTGRGVDYALETSGNPVAFKQAVMSIGTGGVCGIVGAPPMGVEVGIDVNYIIWNRTIRGIVEGESTSDIFIPRLIELYKQDKFPFDKLIRFYELDQINQAAEDSEKGITLKPVLRMPH